jgi:4-diphosphocytidyl-2-C-methyl-D-erythritol kinase
MSIDVLAFAKLNLSLRVLGLREDGFHEIASEVQTVDLSDRLSISLAPSGVSVDSQLARQGTDIVERAAVTLLRRKRSDRGVHVRVEKAIPIGAGLGGGSSDAASLLSVLDRLIPPVLPYEEILEAGVEIGSDVPLFLTGGRLLVGGRGEQVQRLPGPSNRQFVLLVPPVHCDTGAIYARWDAIAPAPRAKADAPLRRGVNDLLASALDVHPALIPYHRAVEALACDYCGMSGSGSSFYAAFDVPTSAEEAAAELANRFPAADVFVCRPTTTGYRIAEGE